MYCFTQDEISSLNLKQLKNLFERRPNSKTFSASEYINIRYSEKVLPALSPLV
jgi:hypothetical protein